MLDYDPKNCKYIKDTEMRPCTSQKKRDRINDNDDDDSPKKKKGRGCPSEKMKEQQKISKDYDEAKFGLEKNFRIFPGSFRPQ